MKNYRKRTKQNSPQIGPIFGIPSTNRFKVNKTTKQIIKVKEILNSMNRIIKWRWVWQELKWSILNNRDLQYLHAHWHLHSLLVYVHFQKEESNWNNQFLEYQIQVYTFQIHKKSIDYPSIEETTFWYKISPFRIIETL